MNRFHTFSGASIVNFEEVNAGRDKIQRKPNTCIPSNCLDFISTHALIG